MSQGKGRAGLIAVGLLLVAGVGVFLLLRQQREAVSAPVELRDSASAEAAPPEFSRAAEAPAPLAAVPEMSAPTTTHVATSTEAPAVASLHVLVVNSDRQPVPDATVWLKTAPLKTLRTGDDGVATITGEPSAEVDVAARHPDYRFGTARATLPARGEPPGEVTIVLTIELTACLLVEDERGGAIAGASVSFQEVRKEETFLRSSLIATPDELTTELSQELFKDHFDETRLTGADGRCCVAGITAGPVRVDVRAPGFVWASHRTYTVGPRGGDMGVVKLTPARVLHGTVVDAQGPVPDAVLEGLNGGRDTGGYLRVVTDADGRFTLDSLQPDWTWIRLLVSHPTRGDFFEEKFLLPPDDATITLRPSFDLTLLPRDASTKAPVPGPCTVKRLMSFYAFAIRSGEPVGVPLEDGALHVGWVPYYATGVQLEARGFARTTVEMGTIEAARGAPVEVDLVASGTITIHALDGSTGQPVQGAQVYASRLDARNSGPNWLVEVPWDDAAGAYILDTSQFTFTPGADESFVVGAPGHALSERIIVSANGVRVCGPVVDVTLQPKRK